MDLKGVGFGGVDWIRLAQDRARAAGNLLTDYKFVKNTYIELVNLSAATCEICHTPDVCLT